MDPEAERGGPASATADEQAKLLSNRAEDGAAKPVKRQDGHDLGLDDTDNVSTKPDR